MGISGTTLTATSTAPSVAVGSAAATVPDVKKNVVAASSKIKIAKKKSTTTKKKASKPVTIHPDAGLPLCRYTARCRCGGITGIVGTAKGKRKWKTHVVTRRHIKWEASYLAQEASATASESGSSEASDDPSSSESVSDIGKTNVVDLTED